MSKAETATEAEAAGAAAELPVETAAPVGSPVESPSARSDSGAAGQRLAAARIEWGASVGEVAAYLNLSEATIEALESGAHERLPGLTFVKGYLRAYAKLLRLDPDDIIQHAGFAPETPNDIPVAHSITLPTGTADPGFGGNNKTVIDNFTEEDNALIIEEE